MDKVNNSEQVEQPAVTVSTKAAKPSTTYIIVWAATGVVCLVLGMAIGMLVSKHGTVAMADRRTANSSTMNGGNQMPGFGGRGGYYSQGRQSNSRITGVVTAVNGNTLTVAGNGSTYTVTTDSNTQWIGASSASVNDTVVIQYSGSGSSLTALSIRVVGAAATSGSDNSTPMTTNNT